jgi:hypothetical protein
MENSAQANNTSNQNTGSKDTAPRDWWEEREKWREDRHKWRMEMREQRHRWPFHSVFCGLTLVLLGVLFLLNQTGTLTGDTWWQSLLIGLGAISIINGLVRYFTPGYKWGIYGKIIGGIVLILIGTFFMAGISEWWPVILIVAGVAVMSRFFWRRASVLP